jgi:4-carboxymuconolactone decarboxylase
MLSSSWGRDIEWQLERNIHENEVGCFEGADDRYCRRSSVKTSKKRPAKNKLPQDLASLRDRYVELFGMLPALPAARFEFSGDINPEFLALSERLRAHAFYSDVFDVKITQLILFGMLLVEHHPAAQMHAIAARRAGASWEELHKVVELASVTGSLAPANQGSAILKDVRDKESSA